MQIFDITPLGGVVIGGAKNESSNILQASLIVEVVLESRGHPVPKIENPSYPKGVTVNARKTSIDAGAGYNQWLTPCWVMLFNTTKILPPGGLDAAKNTSIWFRYFNSTEDLKQIVIPRGLLARFLKIQLDGYGSLSFAEVEVYSVKLNYLRYYDKGNPVVASTIIDPYQPADPLADSFQFIDMRGIWYLRIQQNLNDKGENQIGGGWSGAYGTISDYVLVITDLSGTVYTFYQDLVAQITSLPKHGSLYFTNREGFDYWDFQEAFQVQETLLISTAPGDGLPRGLCYMDSTCSASAGKGPILDDKRMYGAVPIFNAIRGERVVVYAPDLNYIGPDYFTYVIYDGASLQEHVIQGGVIGTINEVMLNIRVCRRFQQEIKSHFNQSSHPLCACAFNSTATFSSIEECGLAVISICSIKSDFRDFFINMCESCKLSTSISLNTTSIVSGDCSVEIYRAVWFVIDRGLCSSTPRMDCSTSTFTNEGKDSWNYLSLKPPLLYGSLTALGNSFGGYGWFDSSTLA